MTEKINKEDKNWIKIYLILFLIIIAINMLSGERNKITIAIGIFSLSIALIIGGISFIKYWKTKKQNDEEVYKIYERIFKQIADFNDFAKKTGISEKIYKERINHEFLVAYIIGFVNAKYKGYDEKRKDRYIYRIVNWLFPKNGFSLVESKKTAYLLSNNMNSSDRGYEKVKLFARNYREGLKYGKDDAENSYEPYYLYKFLKTGKIIDLFSDKDKHFIKHVHFIDQIGKGLDLSEQEKYKEANEIYKKLLEWEGDKDIEEYLNKVYCNKGWNYLERGRIPEAKKCFEKGLKLNPNNDLLREGLKYTE